MNKRQIARNVGLSYPGTRKIIVHYEAGGMKGLAPGKRGRRTGEKRALTPAQEVHIQKLICDQRPKQLELAFALGSRIAVRQLIEAEFGITLHVSAVGMYLKRWGFTPQKPIQRAYEQSPAAVAAWLEDDYPAIASARKPKVPRFTGAMKPPG